MSFLHSLIVRLRLAVVAIVALFSFNVPNAHAFDFWAFLADLPGPAKMTLNSVIDPMTVEMVLGAKVVFDSCQDFSEPGIIKCIDTLNKNPDFANAVGSDATGGIDMALTIYIKVKTDDYLGLIEVAGKPIACILATMIAGGFPVCSALDLLMDIASGLGDAVGAFFSAIGEGLESACEWVGLCEADGKQVTMAEFIYLNFLKPRVADGVNARMQPTTSTWLELLKNLRNEAASKVGGNAVTEADYTKAFAAYMADVVSQWDAKVGSYENRQLLRSISEKHFATNRLALLKKLHVLPDYGAILTAVKAEGTAARKGIDPYKVYDIWVAESPTGKTSVDPWSDGGLYMAAIGILDKYNEAKKAGCAASGAGNEFTALACSTPSGVIACAKVVASINSAQSGGADIASICKIDKLKPANPAQLKECLSAAAALGRESTQLCDFDKSAFRAKLVQDMKAKDPKGYCTVMADVVTCDRDPAENRICRAVLKDDAPAPFASGLSCKLVRSPAYQALANKVPPTIQMLQTVLADNMKAAAAKVNQGTDPRFHIPPNALASLAPTVTVSGHPVDPLQLTATIATSTEHFAHFEKELRASSKLPPFSPSDPDNGGEEQVALDIKLQSKPTSPQEREMLERLMKGHTAIAVGVPGAAGPAAIQNTAINPVINPSDFARFGSVLQSAISMPAMNTRLSTADVAALKSGLVATANPKQFKANTAEARAAFLKLRDAAPQAGLQLVQ